MAENELTEEEKKRREYNELVSRAGGMPVDSEGQPDLARHNYDQLINRTGQRPEAPMVEEQQQDYFGSGLIEPARAVVEGGLWQVASGYAGMGSQLIPGGMTGADRVKDIQSRSFTPRTPSGQKNMERLGDLVEFGIDVTRLPFAIADGVFKAVTQGPEAGNQAIENVMEQGISKVLGDEVYDRTGSPVAAGIATAVPDAVGATLGFRGGRAIPTPRPVSQAMDLVSPSRRERRTRMEEGSTDGRTVGYRMEPERSQVEPEYRLPARPAPLTIDQPRLPAPEGSQPDAQGAPEYITQGGQYRRIERDPIQKAATKQGVDPGIVTMIRESTPADRAAYARMLDARETSLYNPARAMDERAANVTGDALIERIRFVSETNRAAGRELDVAIDALPRGGAIDVDVPMRNFLTGLRDLDITVNRNGEIDFSGSLMEGTSPEVRAAQKVLTDVVNRSMNTRAPDAYDVHRLKKYIDGMVEFGKSKGGALGEAEYVMKTLRRDLNDLLSDKYESYGAANIKYSDTINALNAFQDAAGKKINFFSDTGRSMAGQSARTLMSHNKSRGAYEDGLNLMEEVALKYGGEFDNNLKYLATFANELDSAKLFGPEAKTGIGGVINQSVPIPQDPQTGLVTRAADYAYDKVMGITNESKMAALRELIGSFD